jgi:3'-5' exoribonuclease
MINQPELVTLVKGDPIDHFLLVRKFEIRLTKAGKEFLSIELGDKSSSVPANIWDDNSAFKSFRDSLSVGDVVKIKGSVDDYQGNPQIKIDAIRIPKQSENVSPADFLPRSKRDLNDMLAEFNKRLNLISNSHLQSLLIKIFNEERLKKYSSAPAGKMWHHGYISGLIEHTLEIIKICDLMCDIHPEINRDLVITGAMLHDFGKIEELSFDSAFEYTDKGKLLGHMVIATIIVNDEINKMNNFPEELKTNIIHLILSHQGKLEHASPVVPKTLEAITLYHADELSAKVNAYKGALEAEAKPNSQWTKFIGLAGTDLFNHGIKNLNNENKTLFD